MSAWEGQLLVEPLFVYNRYRHGHVHRYWCAVKDVILPVGPESGAESELGSIISATSVFMKHGSTSISSATTVDQLCIALNQRLWKYLKNKSNQTNKTSTLPWPRYNANKANKLTLIWPTHFNSWILKKKKKKSSVRKEIKPKTPDGSQHILILGWP